MIEWLGGKLPWEDIAQSVKPTVIHEKKIEAFNDIEGFLNSCFPSPDQPPSLITNMMHFVANLQFEEKPDYGYLRELFLEEIDDSDIEIELKFEMKRGDQKENMDPERASKKKNQKHLKRNKSNHSVNTYEKLREEKIRRNDQESLNNPTPAMVEVLNMIKFKRQNRLGTPDCAVTPKNKKQ